jgi:hypothetical protein
MAYSILTEEPRTSLSGIPLVTSREAAMRRNRGPSSANNSLDTKESQAELLRFRRRLVEWMPSSYCDTMARSAGAVAIER